MPKRLIFPLLLGAGCLVLGAVNASAQATNGAYTLTNEMLISAGGRMNGSESAETCLGVPASGAATNGAFSLTDGHAESGGQPLTSPLTVTGTINDPAAVVTVNGVTAMINGSTFTAAGVMLSPGPNTITATAQDAAGNQTSASMQVYLDIPLQQKTPRFTVPVRGAITDPAATVVVNGIKATITSGTYQADVLLTNGVNTLTAIATDPAGNQASASIRVYVPLPLQMPPMPTVGTAGYTLPEVITQASATIGGTKTKDTSIWINGQQQVAANAQETWSATVTLVEGDNWLSIVARDSTGAASAPATVNIVVDNQPTQLTVPATVKTNLNPFAFTGTTDDSRATIRVNGQLATIDHGIFSASIPLSGATTPVAITAISPNGYSSSASSSVTRGTIPALSAVVPNAPTKALLGATLTFQASASDAEGDPMSYRLLLNGTPLNTWQSSPSLPWTPALSQLGTQQVTVEVQDGFGGSDTKEIDAFVLHAPVPHP